MCLRKNYVEIGALSEYSRWRADSRWSWDRRNLEYECHKKPKCKGDKTNPSAKITFIPQNRQLVNMVPEVILQKEFPRMLYDMKERRGKWDETTSNRDEYDT